MARKKLDTLSEQMHYVLLALQKERCGTEIAQEVKEISHQRIQLGPGTLYTILSQFEEAGIIAETKVEGRKRSYLITAQGLQLLKNEFQRLQQMIKDTQDAMSRKEKNEKEI